jgi:peptide deformylase
MAVLPIVQIGDPMLRQIASEVPPLEIASPEIQNLIDQMIETMRAAPGVGLAAPQVGQAKRIIIVEDPPQAIASLSEAQREERQRSETFDLEIFINPRIRPVPHTTLTVFPEGCLSIPGYAGLVERALAIEIAYYDRQGVFQDWTAMQGWPARIVQHEMDHLDGVLYTDKLVARSLMTDENMRRRTERAPVSALLRELSGEG